jgi:hypothetical protein
MRKILSGLVVGALAVHVYNTQIAPPAEAADMGDESPVAAAAVSLPEPEYQCDGREHCSQMKNCEEAEFFLSNCPNVKMDGDDDGLPCERGPC